MSSVKSIIRRLPLARPLYRLALRAVRSSASPTEIQRLFVNSKDFEAALINKGAGRLTLVTTDGLQFTIRRNLWDARIIEEIFCDRPYVRHVSLSEKPVIVDIGGYIGDFSIWCAKYLHPSRVIVYEPTVENYEVLIENVEQNGFGSIIETMNEAVGRSGWVELNVQSLEFNEFHVSSYLYEHCERRRVASASIGQIFDRHKLQNVDLLKIDCEGSEYDIFESFDPSLLRRTRNIVFEVHKVDGYIEKLMAAKELLRSTGFTLVEEDLMVYALRK